MEDGARTPNTGAKPDIARGGCLTAFLVAIIIINAGGLLYSLNDADYHRSFTQELQLLIGVDGVLNIVVAALVWQWRRVGVYGFIALKLLEFPLNLYVGIPVKPATLGLLFALLILALLVRPRWARFA